MKRLFNVQETAEYLGLAPRTLYNLIYKGRCPVPYKKIGRLIRFDIKDLEKFVDRMPKHTGRLTTPDKFAIDEKPMLD